MQGDPRQTQFLDVITRDEATARFREHLRLSPLGVETVVLDDALDRVLAEDVVATVDVPGFDRSNVDGFAVLAEDTFGAMEETPRSGATERRSARPGNRAAPRALSRASPPRSPPAACCRAAPTPL